MPTIVEPMNDSVIIDDTPKVESEKITDVDNDTEKAKGKRNVNEPIVNKIPQHFYILFKG